MNTQRLWRMALGPASVTISTVLPLDHAVTAMRCRGEPPLYELTPSGGVGGAWIVHRPAHGSPSATFDEASDTLIIQAEAGALSPESLLHLAYLVLERQLQRLGYLTLHAAAAAFGGRAALLIGPTGAGKTTTAVRLCRDHGCELVGNDLVVVGGRNEPRTLTGTRHLRLRYSSLAQVMPELLGFFPATVDDPWRTKIDLAPSQIDVTVAAGPAVVGAVAFVHVDPDYRVLVDEPGDTLVHRLNLHENALRYVRGASTPWLVGDDLAFGPYVPPLDSPTIHEARTASTTRLLTRARYVAGPPVDVARHVASLLQPTPALATTYVS